MSTLSLKILGLFILLFLSAFFSCSETAFFSLSRADIHDLKGSKRGFARSIIRLLQNPRQTLISILFGNELVNVAFSIVVASVIYDLLGDTDWKLSTLISICIAVPLVLIFGEIVPKNVAVRFPRSLTTILVYPVSLFSKMIFPLRFLLTKFADFMVRLFGGDPGQVRSMIMEEEFRQIVDLGYKEGVLEEGESELIHRIFELGNKNLAEIMTPVGEIFRLSIDSPLEKIIKEMKETQFSRVPVYKNHTDDLIGVLHSRDVFRLYRNRQRGRMQEIEKIVRPIHSADKDMCIEDLLTDFQRLKVHIAIVKGKRGKIKGLVTMDDIFRLLFIEKIGVSTSTRRGLLGTGK